MTRRLFQLQALSNDEGGTVSSKAQALRRVHAPGGGMVRWCRSRGVRSAVIFSARQVLQGRF